jgi:hypothetical protein
MYETLVDVRQKNLNPIFMDKTKTNYIESSIAIFKQYKTLAEKAMEQVTDEDFFRQPNPASNSVYLIVKHMSGNMKSRWTDFLTTDGEKPWRNRDDEFEQNEKPTRLEIITLWETGWACLFYALNALTEADLYRVILIRNEPHTVMEGINRQIAHYASHVGQIVFLCKMISNEDWNTLSIAKGKSNEFNSKLMK